MKNCFQNQQCLFAVNGDRSDPVPDRNETLPLFLLVLHRKTCLNGTRTRSSIPRKCLWETRLTFDINAQADKIRQRIASQRCHPAGANVAPSTFITVPLTRTRLPVAELRAPPERFSATVL
jgi:hypothetical protein